VLGEIRKAKTAQKRSLRTEVTTAVVTDTGARLAALAEVAGDVREAGRVARLDTVPLADGSEATVAVTLAPED
jgi:valyl-tRNA synthetase